MERASATALIVLSVLLAAAIPVRADDDATAATSAPATAVSSSRPAAAALNVSRLSFDVMTWQEILRIEKTGGAVENSVANYKGVGLGYERQWRTGERAWALGAWIASGEASGGGTSSNFAYKQGSISWTLLAIEPKLIWILSESIELAAGFVGYYRGVNWPNTSGFRITPSRDVTGLVYGAIDIRLTPRFTLRQSIGVGSLETGPFWRIGLGYAL